MKIRLMLFLVLIMFWVVMALERLPRPEDAFMAEQWTGLFKGLLFLAFLSPIGWGLMILLTVGFGIGLSKRIKAVITADYSKIPNEDKRDQLLKELEKNL